MLHTWCKGQQQEWRQSSDDGREEKHATSAKVIDGQTQEYAGERSSYHPEEVAEVELVGESVQVFGEAVLDACSNESGWQSKIIRLKAGTSNPKNYPLGNISVHLALDLSWHLVISFVV